MTTLIQGDCIEELKKLADNSVDAIVTDPPYGIGFMGKEWDGKAIKEAAAKDQEKRKDLGPESASRPGRKQARSSSAFGSAAHYAGPVRGGNDFQQWCLLWCQEALRVLKPGGYLLAFGGSRTYHRLASAVEDAGFEIRDQIMWLYGSGFPKSLNVGKAIDKKAGAEHLRKFVSENPANRPYNKTTGKTSTGWQSPARPDKTAPATAAAKQWDGWGTALKPAHEPVVVARKPLAGTVAENVLEHGTGAINIDGCRVGTEIINTHHTVRPGGDAVVGRGAKATGEISEHQGRWPANVILDQEAGEIIDGQQPDVSRFFYCPKVAKAERNAGLEGFEEKQWVQWQTGNGASGKPSSMSEGRNTAYCNTHPTVKPIDLMRYLCRLVTPPGGTILDPFLGSGTTGIAAGLEGFEFIGIEREDEYMEIAKARIDWWDKQEGETKEILKKAAAKDKKAAKKSK